MQKTILSVIVLTLFGLANAQINYGGACPNRRVQNDFTLLSFAGLWYEYAKYPDHSEGKSNCATVEFSAIDSNNTYIRRGMICPSNGQASCFYAVAKKISDSKFMVTFSDQRKTPTNYWVLSTDYVTYAITYSCEPASGNSHNTYVWILTRRQFPTSGTIKQTKNVLVSRGITLNHLIATNQISCKSVASDNCS